MPKRPQPLRVFFACLGNSARSQMAEAFCRRLGGARVVCMSGGAKPASRVKPEAVQVMGERGADLQHAKPKPIDEDFVGSCDLIVLMGCPENACPAFVGKRIEDWKLPDPKEGDLEAFRRLRDDIEARVREMLIWQQVLD